MSSCLLSSAYIFVSATILRYCAINSAQAASHVFSCASTITAFPFLNGDACGVFARESAVVDGVIPLALSHPAIAIRQIKGAKNLQKYFMAGLAIVHLSPQAH